MRINKYLADRGYATRRGADELIKLGKVTINGRRAVLGDQVAEGDDVRVTNHISRNTYQYFAYHKPIGIVTPQVNEKGLFPLGRLDKQSHGLMLLTNDGRLTDRLLNPDYHHEKEYAVKTRDKLRDSFKISMERGVDIGGYTTKHCKVTITGEKSFKIVLTEGKKHQIRRMVVAMHNDVTELKRTRIMNIGIGDLQPGKTRILEGEELANFLKAVGL